MNAYSKLAAQRVVAVACVGVLLSFGSNAASQPAPAAPTASPAPEPTPQPPAGDAPAGPQTPPPATTEFTSTQPAEPPPVEPLQLGEAPEPKPPRGPFSKGSIRLTLLVGTGSTRTDNYFIIGGGLGYFLLDGLEVGLDYEAWLFAKPVLQRISPEARYVFHMVPVIKPYVGTFYRRTLVVDYDDYSQVGARIGAYFIPRSNRMYIGGGAVYERTLDCTSSALQDCDSWYPEISFGIAL